MVSMATGRRLAARGGWGFGEPVTDIKAVESGSGLSPHTSVSHFCHFLAVLVKSHESRNQEFVSKDLKVAQ
jgi:hypothetical protein